MALTEKGLADHEARCDERQGQMRADIKEVRETLKSLSRSGWGVVLALLAWAAVNIWNGQIVHPGH